MYSRILLASTYASPTAGDVVCLTSEGGNRVVTLATPSALAVAGSAYGILPVNGTPGAWASVRVSGDVDPRISGLGTAAAGRVRVSSVGRCEHVSSFSNGDFPIGTSDPLHWLTMSPAPQYVVAANNPIVLQSRFAALLVDATPATGPATLLSKTVNGVTVGSSLQLRASVCAWNNTADEGIAIFLRLDGGSFVCQRQSTPSHLANAPQDVSLLWEFPGLSAGSHTIELMWAPPNVGTVHCDPVTVAHGAAGASMIIQEIAT